MQKASILLVVRRWVKLSKGRGSRWKTKEASGVGWYSVSTTQYIQFGKMYQVVELWNMYLLFNTNIIHQEYIFWYILDKDQFALSKWYRLTFANLCTRSGQSADDSGCPQEPSKNTPWRVTESSVSGLNVLIPKVASHVSHSMSQRSREDRHWVLVAYGPDSKSWMCATDQ